MSEKVVILGGGFLGVNAALDLAGSKKEVLLIDKDLTHSYIPGNIDLIRSRFQKEELEIDLKQFLPDEIELIEAEVTDVRTDEKTVETHHGLTGYDQLVIGLGGQPEDFGKNISAAETVWSTENAQKLARKSEEAESALIVGAGYVGIEVAGELAEKEVDTTIVEAQTRPMPYLDQKGSEKILEILQKKGIKFKGGKKVEKVNESGLCVEGGENLDADLVVWAGGVQASQVVQEMFSTSRKGLNVNQGLSVVDEEEIFAGGDCIDLEGQKTAHKAMKQGQVIADNIISDTEPLKQVESEQNFILVSIGDEAGLVFRNKLIYSSELLRTFKDLVKTYYFTRLKIKKKLFNADFLP